MTMNRMAIRTTRVKVPIENFKYATGTTKKAKRWFEEVNDEAFKAIVEEIARRN